MLMLAHQGGWDELLWFSVPIVAVLLWVRWAERKARSRKAKISGVEGEDAPSTLPPHHQDH